MDVQHFAGITDRIEVRAAAGNEMKLNPASDSCQPFLNHELHGGTEHSRERRERVLLQRSPVKLTHSLHVGSSCGILHGKLSLRKHQRAYIEQEQSVRQTSADML